MNRHFRIPLPALTRLVVALALYTACAMHARAATKTWSSGSGDWFADVGNWSGGLPTNGDDVVITAGAVILSNSTPSLASLTMNGGTLTFTNWSTILDATNVTINSSASMNCSGPFTNSIVMSNRVYVVCSNLTVALGGSINVNGKGYLGAPSQSAAAGSGEGGGAAGVSGKGHGGGGGYGGRGGSSGSGADHTATTYPLATGSATYGLPEAPLAPGSGGGAFPGLSSAAGHGGGLIRIEASGAVQLDGSMSANGTAATGQFGGGGSGGGIFLQCSTISGGGTLSANGGSNTLGGGGGGGGGRIAVLYTPVAQSATNNPTGVFSTAAGTASWQNGDIGTLYFPDTRLLSTTMRYVGQMLSPTNVWGVSSLSMTNGCWMRFPQRGVRVTVTGDVSLAAASTLEIGGNSYRYGIVPSTFYKYTLIDTNTVEAVFAVGGNVSLGTGCTVRLWSAQTNASTPDYGVLMSVTGDVSLASNAFVYLAAQMTNGAAPLLRLSNLTVAATGGINADGQGYYARSSTGIGGGPGGGGYGVSGVFSGGGGSYGSVGGGSASGVGGVPYGVPAAPLQAGSCGGAWNSTWFEPGAGGGLIRIEAAGGSRVDGTLTANGVAGTGSSGGGTGGGSGGGIYLQCKTFTGSGLLRANGAGSDAAGNGAGGSGGRIAVTYDAVAQAATSTPTAVFSAAGGVPGGAGQVGDIGTLYFTDAQFLGTTIRHTGSWYSPAFTNWSVSSLTLTNGAWFRIPQDGFRLNVGGHVAIAGASTLDIGANAFITGTVARVFSTGLVASVFTVGGNLNVGTGSALRLSGVYTNAASPDYGLLMTVTGDVTVATNAFIYTGSQSTNGGAPLLRMQNLTLALGSGLNADGLGFMNSSGTGKGGVNGGGGYGGAGGNAAGGSIYGSSNAPLAAGSGGGPVSPVTSGKGGYGGGLIRVEARNTISVDGTVSANGIRASSFSTSGAGGAGGGVLLSCANFTGGAGGVLRANGGNGVSTGGGGGGGRIAVWYGSIRDAERTKLINGLPVNGNGIFLASSNTIDSYTGNVFVAGGTIGSPLAGAGTAVFLTVSYPPAGTVMWVR